MSSFFENIPMTVAVSACSMLVSLLALFYARKNLKMQKYIDVVTVQRIKWIGELRSDFSEILSFIYSSTYVQELADKWDFYKDEVVEEMSAEHYATAEYNIKRLREMGKFEFQESKCIEYIKKIELCILKLNKADEEDAKLIKKLKEMRTIPFGDYRDGHLEEYMNETRDLMGWTLKKEWDRVKKEVKKGGLVNGKRKNIFD